MLNRIQKLLMTEYNDFEDTVLIESSFAQVEENGDGLRAVQLGLTSSNFIIAQDIFHADCQDNVSFKNSLCVDPEIETLEIASIIPLELITLRTYRKGFRLLLKIVLCTGKVMMFEFGGMLLRNLYWNVWRDRIRLIRSSKIKLYYTQEDHHQNAENEGDDEGEVNEKTSLISGGEQGNAKPKLLKIPKMLKDFLDDYNFRTKSGSSNVTPKPPKTASTSAVGSDISLWNDIKDNLLEIEGHQRHKVFKDITEFFIGDNEREPSWSKKTFDECPDENINLLNDMNDDMNDDMNLETTSMAPYEKCCEYLINSCPNAPSSEHSK